MDQQSFDNRALKALSQLQRAGHKAWFVGGCVRDALCGKQFTDYDLATKALPNEMLSIFNLFEIDKKAIKFGCLRINCEGLWLEITTLRQDFNQDGRHTEVIFTKDLALDANRRDFTMNALYWDGKELIDFFEGQSDLLKKNVRFIGNANLRVQEDHLRILRFFRFTAIYADQVDPIGIAACEKYKEGLAYLSGTRVWSEWSKMLCKPNTANVLAQISASEIDTTLFGVKLNLDNNYQGSDPLLLTRLHLPNMQIPHLVHRFSLSKKEGDWLKIADSLALNQDFRELYLEYGLSAHQLVYFWAAKFATSASLELNKQFWQISNPKFPLSGKDLLSCGIGHGPNVGRYLQNTKNWWIENNFVPTHNECLNYAKSLISSVN